MSEREYFSLRYLVPGFSFILIIVGLNFFPIFDFLMKVGGEAGINENMFGIVLSFLTLFAGSSIGFLVSQIWFLVFNSFRGEAKIYGPLEGAMEKYLDWGPRGTGKRDKDIALSTILDYLLLADKDEKKWKFCQRKWDLYIIMKCTLTALAVGLILGLGLRAFLNWSIYGTCMCANLGLPFQFSTLSALSKADVLLFGFTMLIMPICFVVIFFIAKQVFRNYYKMMELFISRVDNDFKKDLKKVFGADYFKNANPTENSDYFY
jgi:hypothetical protein